MIKYQVRSKELIDVVNEIKNRRLIMSPYFQRNLVWRTLHKIDFIKTILLGYPFPQIFIAKGGIDIDNMQTTSCIVDGQQRMNSIVEFINDKFKVDNQNYSELSTGIKEAFLKYQVPIIDLDIQNEDPQIIEIFKRLNRTFYSLSTIEKISTEYAASEFMLLAKLLTKEITFNENEEGEEEDFIPLQNDPNIPESFVIWARKLKIIHFNKFILNSEIFTPYELSRQVHLMFTLNVISTLIGGYFNRNEFTMKYLEDFSNEFPEKDNIVDALETAAQKFLKLKLNKGSYWLNKANCFSIITLFASENQNLKTLNEKETKETLEEAAEKISSEYALAAKEAVNNKRERLIRHNYLEKILFSSKSTSQGKSAKANKSTPIKKRAKPTKLEKTEKRVKAARSAKAKKPR
jgi:hypothetical protein